VISRNLLLRSFDLCGFGFAGIALGVFAAEALNAASRIHKLLLAGEKGMTRRANFNADVAFVCGTGNECVSAGAMHADLAVMGMNGCFHGGS